MLRAPPDDEEHELNTKRRRLMETFARQSNYAGIPGEIIKYITDLMTRPPVYLDYKSLLKAETFWKENLDAEQAKRMNEMFDPFWQYLFELRFPGKPIDPELIDQLTIDPEKQGDEHTYWKRAFEYYLTYKSPITRLVGSNIKDVLWDTPEKIIFITTRHQLRIIDMFSDKYEQHHILEGSHLISTSTEDIMTISTEGSFNYSKQSEYKSGQFTMFSSDNDITKKMDIVYVSKYYSYVFLKSRGDYTLQMNDAKGIQPTRTINLGFQYSSEYIRENFSYGNLNGINIILLTKKQLVPPYQISIYVYVKDSFKLFLNVDSQNLVKHTFSRDSTRLCVITDKAVKIYNIEILNGVITPTQIYNGRSLDIFEVMTHPVRNIEFNTIGTIVYISWRRVQNDLSTDIITYIDIIKGDIHHLKVPFGYTNLVISPNNRYLLAYGTTIPISRGNILSRVNIYSARLPALVGCQAIECNSAAKFICGKCNIATYCSDKCQKNDWKEHLKYCK